MRNRILVIALLVTLPLLGATGCGSTSDDAASGVVTGPCIFGIPFLPLSGQTLAVGARNHGGSAGSVGITAYNEFGSPVAATNTLALPAGGEERTFVPGGVAGWVFAEFFGGAKGLSTLYGERNVTGESGAILGGIFRPGPVYIGVDPWTTAVQLINASKHMATPTPITYSIASYDYQGNMVGSASTVTVPAHGSYQMTVNPSNVARVQATPMTLGGGGAFTSDTEQQSLMAGRLQDLQVSIEVRFLTVSDRFFDRIGVDFDFGIDSDNNVADVGFHVSNSSSSPRNAVIQAVRDSTGTNLLAAPRVVTLPGNGAKFIATTTADSRGLEVGQPSPLADIFGDVSAATMAGYTIEWFVDDDVSVHGANYDSVFGEWRKLLRPNPLSNIIVVSNLPIQETLPSGTRNYITFQNPINSPQTIFVRGNTPGGTQYILDSLTVPAFGRLTYSPDGQRFTETPFNNLEPAVPYMSFTFAPSGGLYVSGRTELRDGANRIVFCRPLIVDPLDS